MTAFPTGFTQAAKPLETAVLGEIGQQASAQLASRGYEVQVGLTPEFAEAIAVMATEPSIREYCPRDSGERFKDRVSAKQWLTKGRAVFLLLRHGPNAKLSLAGYGWVGAGSNEHVPGGKITFAIRIGEAGQGQGLATPFSQLILAGSRALYGASDMWLETWASNGGAVHIYHKLGFVDVAEASGQRLVPDGGKLTDSRIYMSITNELLAKF